MRRGRRPARRRGGRSEGGYNLVILAVLLTIMNVMAAAAMPMWSAAIKREKEEELIFRGFQYAEAIRVFQRRFGHSPVRLEELIEVQPRSIRKMWKDPMSEDGTWGIVYADVDPNAPPLNPDPNAPPRTGPIVGVYSKSSEESIQVLFGQQRHSDWKFTVEALTSGGAAGQALGGDPTFQLKRTEWIGRPFRHEAAPAATGEL